MGLESKNTKTKHSKLKPHSKPGLAKPNGKSTLKAKAKAKEGKKAPSPIPTPQEGDSDWESDQEDSSGDEEDDGVDEEGMARLMKALGDDGLDEFGQAQLDALAGESGGEEEDEVEGGGSGVEDEDSDVEVDGASDSEHSDGDAEEDEDDDGSEGEGDDDELDLEGDVLLEEVDSVDEDAVPRQKIEIDNKVALDQIRESIKLDSSLPWTETLVLSYPHSIDIDVNDDLNRELAFYKQALHGANEARSLAAKHNFPFTRPSDYFAEMVKSDAHMERIRVRLLNESSGIKKSEDKRKEREGKKFGKQVQVEKLKERERSKKEMEERLKGLKRKRKDVLDKPQANDDDFDIAVEDAISDRPAKRGKAANGRGVPRSVRDQKYGFGGASRRSKQNTRESTDNFDSSAGRGRGRGGGRGGARGRGGFGARGGRGGASSGGRGGTKRLGKSRRSASRGKS